jgi:hypothetical protein
MGGLRAHSSVMINPACRLIGGSRPLREKGGWRIRYEGSA